MKIGSARSYWPIISQPAREIAQDAARRGILKPITKTKTTPTKEIK